MHSLIRISQNRGEERSGRLKIEEIAILGLFLTVTLDNLGLVGGTSMVGKDVTLAKLATVTALGVVIARALIMKRENLFRMAFANVTSFFMWAFIVISLLSVINSTNPNTVSYAPGSLFLIFRRLNLVLLYYAVIWIVRDRKMMKYAMLALVLGGIPTCLAGVYEMATKEQFLDRLPTGREALVQARTGAVRVQGLESDADVHAVFLLLGTAFLFYFFYRSSSWKRVAYSGLLLLYLVNIVSTGSRGAWIGLALVLGVYFVLLDDPRKWKIFGMGAVLALLTFAFLSLNPNIIILDKITGDVSPSTDLRLGWMRMAWEMVKDHPFLGIGTGDYLNCYHRYSHVASSSLPLQPLDIPNGYMKVWAENGTIGVVIFLLMLLSPVFEAWTALKKKAGRDEKLLGVAALSAYGAILWVLVVFPVIDGKYMWLAIALLVAYGNMLNRPIGTLAPAGTA